MFLDIHCIYLLFQNICIMYVLILLEIAKLYLFILCREVVSHVKSIDSSHRPVTAALNADYNKEKAVSFVIFYFIFHLIKYFDFINKYCWIEFV